MPCACTACSVTHATLCTGKKDTAVDGDRLELIGALCGAAANIALHEPLRPRFGSAPGAAAALVEVAKCSRYDDAYSQL
jgi:hypothetical protein